MTTEEAMALIWKQLTTDPIPNVRILPEVLNNKDGLRFQFSNGVEFDYSKDEGFSECMKIKVGST